MNIIQLLYMVETNNENTGLNNIETMYKNLTYFDQYGSSVLLLIVITVIVGVLCAYCYAKTHIKPIVNDWSNQRCKPYYMPFAGFITKPDNMTAIDYTMENFNYCSQNILTSITGFMLEPLTFVSNTLNSLMSNASQDINLIRVMFSKVRTFFQSISEEIMGRIMNIMIPLQQIIISFRDMIGKVQGALTAGLFTLLGSYYTLQSLMGSIAEFVIIILIAMVALIVIFWIVPFTWGAAVSMTSIFVAISIPLAIILAFMLDVLHVQPDLSIPTLKCFDKDTLILMKDKTNKKIEDICLGDELFHDGFVTAKMKVETKGSIMYRLNNVIVSDSHLVHYKGEWLRVSEHPESKKIDKYDEPFLYCLNTSSKTIYINNTLFSDWDELVGNDFIQIAGNTVMPQPFKSSEIHVYLDGGFFANTQIALKNNRFKEIKNIMVGDILSNNEIVCGIVEIDGKKIKQQYEYILGKNICIKGGPNINIKIENKKNGVFSTLNLSEGNNKKVIKNNEEKLYHLITNTKTFYINELEFYDYNKTIDIFLEKV